jgi:tRNA/tmRNA/rRNA uracil-C5-methylase (TrmA/RlmC/RlmD family)
VDLYAGVGLFAVAAAASGSRDVAAVEGDRLAAADLKRNTTTVTSVAARYQAVETFLAVEPTRPGVTMIVDPPRTGLSKDALKGLLHWMASKVVYVSCDVATFARDARGLIDGGYQLRELQAFDLFPNTAHVETVAVFAR